MRRNVGHTIHCLIATLWSTSARSERPWRRLASFVFVTDDMKPMSKGKSVSPAFEQCPEHSLILQGSNLSKHRRWLTTWMQLAGQQPQNDITTHSANISRCSAPGFPIFHHPFQHISK